MNKRKFILFKKIKQMKKTVLFYIWILASCSDNEIQEDANRFCECRSNNKEQPQKCNPLLEELDQKYQFDPPGSTQLKAAIEECLKE